MLAQNLTVTIFFVSKKNSGTFKFVPAQPIFFQRKKNCIIDLRKRITNTQNCELPSRILKFHDFLMNTLISVCPLFSYLNVN